MSVCIDLTPVVEKTFLVTQSVFLKMAYYQYFSRRGSILIIAFYLQYLEVKKLTAGLLCVMWTTLVQKYKIHISAHRVAENRRV